MKNKLVSLFLLTVLACTVFAQNQANSWIDYNQRYYRFAVVENGIYRISYADMVAAGIPASSINPQQFQVMGRGKQVPLYVHTQLNGVFGPGDYIEFYALRNDGWYDSALYKLPEWQVDTSYSLFNDTASYFLSWSSSFSNSRMALENDVNYNSYSPTPYILYSSYQSYNYEYLGGIPLVETSGETVFNPEYAEGEGFYDYSIFLGGSRSRSVSTKNAYANGTARVRFAIHGASNYRSLNNDHHLRIQFAGQQIDTIYEGYTVLHFTRHVPNSGLGSSSTAFTFSSINDLGSGADRNAVSFIEIKYRHTLDLEGSNYFRFSCDDAPSQSKSYFVFTNFNGGNNPLLYDLSNHKRISVTKSGNSYKALIPNAGGEKSCVLVADNKVHTGISLTPVGNNGYFVDFLAQKPNADYLLITHSSLMGNGQGQYTATDYAAYRSSTGYHVLLVDVERLYDQYAYGIRKNPMAIRNFIKDAFVRLNNPPKYLFLMGKAYYPSAYRKDTATYNRTLVPSFGDAPSDGLLSAHIVDSTYKPALGTGRLSAKNIDHVDLYLNKVMQYEDSVINPPSLWMKKALFFSGGDYASLQNQIAGYMKNMARIYRDTFLGGHVKTYYKTSTDPVQVNLATYIKAEINNGVGMLNFFGHAAGIGFDISIDNPSEYSNYGKYPFLLANSCFAGDIFQTNNGIANSSEAFILIRDKGAIAYLGAITTGITSYLNVYSSRLMKNYSRYLYGKPLGDIMRQTVWDVDNNLPLMKETSMEMTLHGDPGLVLYSFPQPDYQISQSSVFFTPAIVTTAVDSFQLNLVVNNRGKAVNDSIIIEVRRTLPDGATQQIKQKLIVGTYYSDTIAFRFPLNALTDIGNNRFNIKVDANNTVSELDENNNEVNTILQIKAADLLPVYPKEFSIIPDAHPVLKASTYYALTPALDYIFQLDTAADFSSPLMEEYKLNSTGGVIEWTPSQSLIDSAVYYWRVSLDSTYEHHFNWRNSSFQYLASTKGWSQAHFFQFKNNNYRLAKWDEAHRHFEFANEIIYLKAINGIYPYIGWTEPQYRLNNVQMSYWQCVLNGMKIAVIDPVSGEPWMSIPQSHYVGQYDNYHCKSYAYPSFEFSTETSVNWPTQPSTIPDSVWFRRQADFIAHIPDGYLVLARSAQNSFVTHWPEYLYKAYDSLGANYIRNINDNIPYLLWGVKGQLGGATEVIGSSVSDHIQLSDSIITHWKKGYIESPLIGPARKWQELIWKVHSQDVINTDSVRLALVAIEHDGTIDTVFSGLTPDSMRVTKLNDMMPANDYPYCKLIAFMSDDSLHTPAYIDYWMVKYSGAPELAVAPKKHFSFYADTLDRGDTLSIEIAYENISDINFDDSLLVHYWLTDHSNTIHDMGLRRISPVGAGKYIVDTFSLPTANLIGLNSLKLDINTINPNTHTFDHIEITHDNNTLELPFFVKKDDSNPLLDVTFDGVHILDGDIVSANPQIQISLFDDNRFIALDDTSAFRVYLQNPGQLARKRIYFTMGGEEIMQFLPAEKPGEKASVIYQPRLTEDGEYRLYIQAVDATLNQAGTNEYSITFNVINKATITHVMNWPNPFTTKTHFVFTLTGTQVPDYFLIQIMTISGKVVKEIGMDELGDLHIGRNITSYTWDGTDDYGDRLANGVYLYRVLTRLNGDDVELRNSGADKYFKNEFGKMYLIR